MHTATTDTVTTSAVQTLAGMLQTATTRLGQGVAAHARRRQRRRAERRALAALDALDDRTLRDIGLTRGQLRGVARRLLEQPGLDPREDQR